MDNIGYQASDGILTLKLSGRIDSGNAPDVEAKYLAIRKKHDEKTVEIDCEKVEYLSSAGLRFILRVKKENPDTTVINVPSAVYEIFEVTGFTEMMTIRKTYRELSVEGCEIIGQGANGKVYRIDPDTIVKVYLNPDSLSEIQRERELARSAFILGIPTAIPYDVVRITGGGYGSVFELLNAKSLAKLVSSGEKSLDEVVKISIGLLKQIHATVVKPETMPDMRSVALGWADYLKDYLPKDQSDKLCRLVSEVPVDDHMLHGDYHLKNVMVQNDEALLIDMDTLCHGHPVFELASMFNAYVAFGELDQASSESFLGIPYKVANEIWKKSLRLYLDGTDKKKIPEVEKKAMLIGYSRIMRRNIRRNALKTPEGRAQIDICAKHIAQLLQEVDTLLF